MFQSLPDRELYVRKKYDAAPRLGAWSLALLSPVQHGRLVCKILYCDIMVRVSVLSVLNESIWLVCIVIFLILRIYDGSVEEHDSFGCSVLRLGYVTSTIFISINRIERYWCTIPCASFRYAFQSCNLLYGQQCLYNGKMTHDLTIWNTQTYKYWHSALLLSLPHAFSTKVLKWQL